MMDYLKEYRKQHNGVYDDIPDEALKSALLQSDPQKWGPLLGPMAAPGMGNPNAPQPANVTGTDLMSGANKAAGVALPIAGGIVGGAMGLPAGPGGAVIGGGLGAAGGSFLADAVNNATAQINPNAAQTRGTGQQLRGAAESGIAGMAGEGVGQMAMGMAGKFARRGMSSADAGFMQDAARMKIPTTAGENTLNPTVGMLESYPGRFPVGVGPIEKFGKSRRNSIQAAGEDIGAGMGAKTDLQTAGSTIKAELDQLRNAQVSAGEEAVTRFAESMGRPKARVAFGDEVSGALKKASEQRREQASTLYDAVEQQVGNVQAPAMRLYQAASQISQKEASVGGVANSQLSKTAGGIEATVGPPQISGPLNLQNLPADFVRQHGLDRPRDLSFANLREYQARLSGLIRSSQDDYTKRQLRGLHDAVSDDIDQLGGQGVRVANQFYRQEVAQYFGKGTFTRNLMDVSEKDRIVDRLMQVDSPTMVDRIMRLLPTDTKGTYRASFVQRLHDEGLDAATGQWSAEKFLRASSQYTDDTLKALMGPSKWDEFGKMRSSLQRQSQPASSEPVYGQMARTDEPLVVGKLLRKNGAEDVTAVFANLSPEAKRQAQSSAWDGVLQKSIDPQTNTWSNHRFLGEVNKVDDATWKAFLEPDAYQAFGQFKRVLQRIQTSGRIGENPSQTARGIGAMSQISGASALGGAVMLGGAGPGAVAIGGLTLATPYMLGRLLTSKRGIDLLTQGVMAKPGTELAVRVTSDLAAFAAKEGLTN